MPKIVFYDEETRVFTMKPCLLVLFFFFIKDFYRSRFFKYIFTMILRHLLKDSGQPCASPAGYI